MPLTNSDADVADSKPEQTPQSKVVGVVEDQAQFQAVAQALAPLGVSEVEALEGAAGSALIEHWKVAYSQTFLGDMESEMVRRYASAVESGRIVFAATVEPAIADEAAVMAKGLGAREVVHFGTWRVTSF